MSKMSKQVGYLKGLIDAASLDESKLENKLFAGIIELLSELSDHADEVDDLLEDLNDYVESIDDDLSVLEGEESSPFSVFDTEDEDEDDEDDDDDFDFSEDQLHILRPETPAAPQSVPMLCALCPDCLHLFFVSPDDPADAMYTCPHCGKQIRPVPLSTMDAPVVSPEKDD